MTIAPILFTAPYTGTRHADLSVALTFEQRQKARLRTTSDDGRDIGLVLERGQILRGGTLLTGPHKLVLSVTASLEAISEVRPAETAATPEQDLTRAAYHLGNRHVSLQVGPDFLRYLHDHVLDEMVRGLGLNVNTRCAAFEPEAGAYTVTAPPPHHHHE